MKYILIGLIIIVILCCAAVSIHEGMDSLDLERIVEQRKAETNSTSPNSTPEALSANNRIITQANSYMSTFINLSNNTLNDSVIAQIRQLNPNTVTILVAIAKNAYMFLSQLKTAQLTPDKDTATLVNDVISKFVYNPTAQ